MTAPSLASAKEALQKRLAQIEEIERAREELERKSKELAEQEAEIAKWLGETESAPSPSRRLLGGSAGEVHIRQTMLETDAANPQTQKEWIYHLLVKHGAMTRDDLFEKMQPTGKAPASVDQLSAILSRGKKEGRLGVLPDFRWYPISS